MEWIEWRKAKKSNFWKNIKTGEYIGINKINNIFKPYKVQAVTGRDIRDVYCKTLEEAKSFVRVWIRFH